MEAKKQGAGEEDLSMEEILQSIRRIIADDNEGDKTVAPLNGGSEPKEASSSDILELTDMIEDDGSITNLKEEKANIDVLSNIDAALAPVPAAEAPVAVEIKPEPQPQAPEIQPSQVTAPAVEQKVEAPTPSAQELDALLSKTAEEATLSSLSKLNVPEEKPVYRSTTPSPQFRSGATIEDMVEEMIRPILKDWLDANLPVIVERIVEREVTRLSRR